MDYRLAKENEYGQLAEMKWLHCAEDDEDYGERNLAGVDRENFFQEFTAFLREHGEYLKFVAAEGNTVASAMFVYRVPKVPKPNRKTQSIAYLTNVYTRREFRGRGVGAALLGFIKKTLRGEDCELVFAWPSEKSAKWYQRNGFSPENEIVECVLMEE